ncbi:MAG: zinc ribbon domain-containing protein [Armatimonadetes bacterium]|nr:zinc ribbon domain-containing protein [Armatimonadota bacterium]
MRCPKCQTENTAERAFCQGCNNPLIPAMPPLAPAAPKTVSAIPMPQAQSQRSQVQTVLPPPLIPYQCRVCGVLYPSYRYCPNCLTPIGTIANPNDATCTTYLQIGYPYPTETNNQREPDS